MLTSTGETDGVRDAEGSEEKDGVGIGSSVGGVSGTSGVGSSSSSRAVMSRP